MIRAWVYALFAGAIGLPSASRAGDVPEVSVQAGHARPVRAACFLHQSAAVITASSDKTLKLWDVDSGRELRTFEGHSASITSVAVSPDDRYAASGSEDRSVRVWEIATGQNTLTLQGHQHWVMSVAFSPDGRYLISANADQVIGRVAGTIKLWDVKTGKEVRTFAGHGGSVWSVNFSPDGRRILSGNGDKTARVWDVAAGSELRALPVAASVASVMYSPDGRHALINKRLWDLESGRTVGEMPEDQGNAGASFSTDGSEVFTLTCGVRLENNSSRLAGDATFEVWDSATGRRRRAVALPAFDSGALAFSTDGRLVLSRKLDVWDVTTGRLRRRLEGHQRMAASVRFSPDGSHALWASGAEAVLWQWKTGREVRRFAGHAGTVVDAGFSPDGCRIVTSGGRDKTIRLWDAATGNTVWTVAANEIVNSVKFSPDGRTIAGAGNGLWLWSAADGRPTDGLKCSGPMSFLPDNRRMMAFCKVGSPEEDRLGIWDLSTGRSTVLWMPRMVRVPSKGTAFTDTAAVSPDGRFLATSLGTGLDPRADGGMMLWDVASGAPLRTFERHTGPITSIAFSRDNRYLLSGSGNRLFRSSDRTVRLWEVATGRQLHCFRGHRDAVTSAAFSPDGRFALSAGQDGTVRVWSNSTGKELAQMIALANEEWITVTPEGYYSGSENSSRYLNVRLGSQVYRMDQFYDAFYRPDLVEKKLQGEDISRYTNAVTIVEALQNPPPLVEIVAPLSGSAGAAREIELRVRAHDQGGGVGDIRVYHNGKLVDSMGVYRLARTGGERQPGLRAGKPAPPGYPAAISGFGLRRVQTDPSGPELRDVEFTPLHGEVERLFRVRLIGGENIVSVAAFNGTNTVISSPATVRLTVAAAPEPPRLFVLAVGNGHFHNPVYNLNTTQSDARDFASRMQRAAAYADIRASVLVDTGKADLLKALAAISGQMRPEDVLVLYLATHGRAEDDLYYIYTSDFDGNVRDSRSRISSLELMEISKRAPALKQVYILDTCQAGGIEAAVAGLYDARISVFARALGMHVLAGSKQSQDAQDDYQGNGLFTHFLLHALAGGADANHDRMITVREISPYLAKAVAEASHGRQEPFIRNFGDDLSMTRVP